MALGRVVRTYFIILLVVGVTVWICSQLDVSLRRLQEEEPIHLQIKGASSASPHV